MKTIDMTEFARAAYQCPITDVFVGVESISEGKPKHWAMMEGGPILLCFSDRCLIMRQPIGRCGIEFVQSTLGEWSNAITQEYPELDIGFLRIFEQACFRLDLNDLPPKVSNILVFQNRDSKTNEGLILELTTGGSLGIDASSYGGLVWFLDGQVSIYRRECVNSLLLEEHIIPRPSI